jgi:PAS domain S-box-containing protein
MRFDLKASFFSTRLQPGDKPVSLLTHLLLGGFGGGVIGLLWHQIAILSSQGAGMSADVAFFEGMLVGIAAGWIVFLSARRLYRRAYREAEILRSVVESTSVGIWIVDDRMRTAWWNSAMKLIVGRELRRGEEGTSYFTERGRRRVIQEVSRRSLGISSTYETTIEQPDGAIRTVQVAGSPIFSAEGEYRGSFGVFRDITDQLQAQEEATEEARLDTVVATVSRLNHKINNALMIIRGQSEVRVRQGVIEEDAKSYQRIIEQVDIIGDELEALTELKQVQTERYLGDRSMLALPEDEEKLGQE